MQCEFLNCGIIFVLLAQINIIVAIKKDFKIDFSMEEIGKLKNVGEIVKKIEEKL